MYNYTILNSEPLKIIKNSELEPGSCFVLLDKDTVSFPHVILYV